VTTIQTFWGFPAAFGHGGYRPFSSSALFLYCFLSHSSIFSFTS